MVFRYLWLEVMKYCLLVKYFSSLFLFLQIKNLFGNGVNNAFPIHLGEENKDSGRKMSNNGESQR